MKLLIPISLAIICVSFTTISSKQENMPGLVSVTAENDPLPYTKWTADITPVSTKALFLYENMMLKEVGLSEAAFEYAYKGYQNLLAKNKLTNTDYLTICDFSQSSKNKRFYVIDLKNQKVLVNTYVAHGRNSGAEYASRFSNRPESLQSSLGFYVTSNTYFGEHGLSLKIEGVDNGFNTNAARRKIVIHGAAYIGDNYLHSRPFMGRSFGCPAVPQKECSGIINIIKNGTCLFIYHPDRKYENGSKILNG